MWFRKLLKILSVFILILLGIAALIVLTINLPFARKFLTQTINNNLERSEMPVRIGALNTIRFVEISASDILVSGENSDTILFAGNLDVHFKPAAILRKKILLTSVDLQNLVIRLMQEDDNRSLNLVSAFNPDTTKQNDNEKDTSGAWTFDIREIMLESLDFQYHSKPQKMLANLQLEQAVVRTDKMDLSEKRLIVPLIRLTGVNAGIYTDSDNKDSVSAEAFVFPWNIEVESIRMVNCGFKSGAYSKLNDPETLSIAGLNSELTGITLTPDRLALRVNNTGFRMDNGFELKDLKGEIDSYLAETVFEVHVSTGLSDLHVRGSADTILFAIPKNPGNASVSINGSSIDPAELLYFNPEIANASWFDKFGTMPVSIEAKVVQSDHITRFDSLYLYQSHGQWLSATGEISNITDPSVPKHFDLRLFSSSGDISLNGNIDLAKEWIIARADFRDIRPGNILKQKVLQEVNGSFTADIKGFSIDKLQSSFDLNLNSVIVNDHQYDEITLGGNVSPHYINVTSGIKDDAITLELQTSVERNGNRISAETNGDLSITPVMLFPEMDTMTLNGRLSGRLYKTPDSLLTGAEMTDIILSTPGSRSRIDSLLVNMESDSLSTMLTGITDFMELKFDMEGPVKEAPVLIAKLSDYFRALASNFILDSSFRHFDIPESHLDLKLAFHPVLHVLTGDTSLGFSDASARVSVAGESGKFSGDFRADEIRAGSLLINRLHTDYSDSSGTITFKTRVDDISAASQTFSSIEIDHKSNDSTNKGLTALLIRKDGKKNSEIEIASEFKDSFLILTLPAGRVLVNGTEWQTGSEELVRYDRRIGEFLPEITLFTDSSELRFVTVRENPSKGFDVFFDRVSLGSLIPTGFLPGSPGAGIDGSIHYRTSGNEDSRLDADLDLFDVSWSDMQIDHMSVDGSYSSSGSESYSAEADVNMDRSSIHVEARKESIHDQMIATRFSKLSLSLLSPFVQNSISELSGIVSGNVSLSGATKKTDLDGDINLHDVRAHINALNTMFRIPDNSISLNDSKIKLDSFRILDSRDNELFVNGNIDFQNRDAVNANLEISSPNMLVMNSTKEDNSWFYGTIMVGTRLSVTGPLTAPRIEGNLSLNNGTEIYYANQTRYQLQDMTQTVTFIDADSPDSSERNHVVVSDQASPTIGATVEVNPATIIHFNLQDQLYNINLEIHGGGILNYNVLSNNQSNLSGIYEIRDGNADLKFSGWSEKKFSISEGSFIRWTDQMEDPELQIEAHSTVTGKYKNPNERRDRIVEFDVVLKLANRLSDLEVLFTVITEDQYLMSIINSMSVEEQMKQAVSLLLFQSINIPGIYTTSNQITDQVNQIVESQLNKLTQTSIKDFDISLGVDSYTVPVEGGSEETQTSLSYDIKKDILNERASIEVSGRLNNLGESGTDDYTLNNFTFEYRLDSAATKFIQVFRERSYEDILEGEVERTGFGLIFRKAFDSVRDIFPGNRKRHNNNYPE